MPRPRFARSCCTTPSAMCFWGAMFVILYGAGLLLRVAWPALGAYVDTLILSALAAACFVNFGRHRTLHCALTGPVFLLAAIVAALDEAGIWKIDIVFLWGVVLVCVGVASCNGFASRSTPLGAAAIRRSSTRHSGSTSALNASPLKQLFDVCCVKNCLAI